MMNRKATRGTGRFVARPAPERVTAGLPFRSHRLVHSDAATRRRQIASGLALVGVLLAATVGRSFGDWQAALDSDQGDMLRQLLLGGIFVVLLLVAGPVAMPSPRRRGLMAWFPLPVSLLLLLGWCLLSISWAVAPLVSARRFALTAMVIWILFRAVAELGYARTLALVRWTLLVILVANYLSLLVPDLGIQPYTIGGDPSVVGDWRGLQPHKNLGGAVCALTILFFLFDRRAIPPYLGGFVILLAALFLYFSHSKTAQGILLLAILAGLAIRPYSSDYRALLAPFAVLLAGLLLQLAWLYLPQFDAWLDDPSALTGRSQIWPILLRYGSEHPLTGAGFGSFWQVGYDSPIWDFTRGWIAQTAGHGHNGYLDLLVTIGAPGLILAILALFLWPTLRLLMSHAVPKPRRSLLLAALTFCAGHNLTETSLMDRVSVVQVFLILAVALIYEQSQASEGGYAFWRARSLRLLLGLRARKPRTVRLSRP